MLHRVLGLSFGGVALMAMGGITNAAIPSDGAQPFDKPALNRASPMINDRLIGTPIRGKAPVGSNAIRNDNIQVVLPDAKTPLYRASPMINDPVTGTPIHGTPPAKADPQ